MAEREGFQWSKGDLVKMTPIGDGEPCPHCKEKLPRFFAERNPDGSLSVLISCRIPAAIVASEINGIVQLLEMFVYGLRGKPKDHERSRRSGKNSNVVKR